MSFDRGRLIATLESPEAENFRAVPYDDVTGFPVARGDEIKGNLTTGIGWNLLAKPLTREQGRVICGWHLDDVASQLQAFPWFAGLDEPRARAIAEMCFQLGGGALSQFKVMIACIRAQAWNAAADAALDSDWARECPKRAARIAAVIRTGTDQ